MTEKIEILIADDHDLVRSGIKTALSQHDDLVVVAEARDGAQAISEAIRVRPNVVIMDVRMPNVNGIEACREIRSQLESTQVLMLTSYSDDRAVLAALVAGASGFLLKDVRTSDLIDAVRVVGTGGSILDPSSAGAIIEQLRKGNFQTDEERTAQELNDRELEILDLISEGLTNREIGARLYLSEKTVKHHVSDLLAKLGLARRVEAAGFAIRLKASREASGF